MPHPFTSLSASRFARTAASLACLLGTVTLFATFARAGEVPVTSVAGFPNGRTFNDLPANAIDGDTTTFTWTTNPNNIASPSHLAIGFASTPVNRLRLWKDRNGGGGQNIKNLVIQYTTDDPGVPLASRNWITVTNLSNGNGAGENLVATAVNANGTVTGDIHDSPTGDGWATLRFDLVTATGLRVSFSPPNPTAPCDGINPNGACNHYHVGEFEAYAPDYLPGLGPWGVLALSLLIGGAGVSFLSRRARPSGGAARM